jgi:hypothetical protein
VIDQLIKEGTVDGFRCYERTIPHTTNYRAEEKKILDSILGKDVYDNRIRPSGANGTGSRCGDGVKPNRDCITENSKRTC